MADSVLVKIADALVEAINAETWTPSAEAAREWLPEFTPKQLDAIKLTVVVAGRDSEIVSRSSWERRYLMNVGIQKRHGGQPGDHAPTEKIDPLDGLAESLMGFLESTVLTVPDVGSARPMKVKNPNILADETLAKARTFTSVLTVEYRVGP